MSLRDSGLTRAVLPLRVVGQRGVGQVAGKILVIDDDDAFLSCVARALEAQGHRVWTATDGRGGMEVAQRERPDVIVVDLLMAPPDGFAVTDELRNRPETQRAGILVVSAVGKKLHKHFASPEIGARLDVDGFLEKPVALDVLVRRVEEMLRLARSRAEASGESP